MHSRDAEDLAIRVLVGLGLEVRRVLTTDTKTPDLLASDPPGGQYAIEVKARFDDEAFRADLQDEGVAMGEIRLDASGSVASDIKNAAQQLLGIAPGDRAVSRLVMYVLAGGAFSTSLHAEQLQATLFGTVRVNDPFDPSFPAQPCFYLGRSAFRDHPLVEGALLLDPSLPALGLYPNPFAAGDVRKTFLGTRLAAEAAIFSPEDAVGRGAGLLCDAPIGATFRDRLRFVQKKYGRRFSPMQSAGWRAEMKVDIGSSQGEE